MNRGENPNPTPISEKEINMDINPVERISAVFEKYKEMPNLLRRFVISAEQVADGKLKTIVEWIWETAGGTPADEVLIFIEMRAQTKDASITEASSLIAKVKSYLPEYDEARIDETLDVHVYCLPTFRWLSFVPICEYYQNP